MDDAMNPTPEFSTAVYSVCREMRIGIFGIDGPPAENALGLYRPTDPPRILYDSTRVSPEDDLPLVVIHELFHALLHPVLDGAHEGFESPLEERIAHHCAIRLCRQFGVRGYRELMQRNGAMIDAPGFFDGPIVDQLVALMSAAMADPAIVADWPVEDPAEACRLMIENFGETV